MSEAKKLRLYEVRIPARIFDVDDGQNEFEVNLAQGDVPYMSCLIHAQSPHSAQHAIMFTLEGLTRKVQNAVAAGSEYPVDAMLRGPHHDPEAN